MDAETLGRLETEMTAEIADCKDLPSLDGVRISALGKKGRVSALMQQLGSMAPEDRKTFGQTVNALKTRISSALDTRRGELEGAELAQRLATERADVTLPVRVGPLAEGRIHPVSQVFDEIAEIFADMGFAVAEGPDIELDDYNFERLNIPADHPARQEHDTFYLHGSLPSDTMAANQQRKVLRTHTSPVQIRTMMTQKPPIRVIAPGAFIAATATRHIRRCFIRLKGLSSTRRRTLAT